MWYLFLVVAPFHIYFLTHASPLLGFFRPSRPASLNDVLLNPGNTAVRGLREGLRTGSMPHLLFYGPPGTGKTTTILALAKELYGDRVSQFVLELNASDERGIKVVREKIKRFAEVGTGAGADGPPFRLVILDEADSLTADAQAALRCTIEKFTVFTRFCFICNYVTKVSEPIASRCAKYRFGKLPADAVRDCVLRVVHEERVDIDTDAMEELILRCDGDLRRTLTCLQGAARYACGRSISVAHVHEVCEVVPVEALGRLWYAILHMRAHDVCVQADEVRSKGFALAHVLSALFDIIVAAPSDALSDSRKAAMCVQLALADKNVADGGDEELHCCAIALRLFQIANPGL